MAKRKSKKGKSNLVKRALIASLLIHLLVFMTISLKGCNGGKGSDKNGNGSGSQEDVGNILDKPEDKTVDIELVPQESIPAPKVPKPKKETLKKACKGFGGIGVEYSSIDGTIANVPRGYPAHRAGILPGDQIISPGINQIRGTPGTKIELAIRRGDSIHYLTLVREMICTDGIKDGDLQDKENP